MILSEISRQLGRLDAPGQIVVGDIPLLVSDGLTGYLVNPGDATGLTRRMRDLIVMPEAAQVMAQEGGRLVNERFSATSMVGKTQELYLSLIGGQG